MAGDPVSKLFEGPTPSGVYWLKSHAQVADLAKLAKAKKLAFFHLEGEKMERKEQFLNHASVVMRFPDYFGNNWDAFEECITDFEWIKAEGFVIYFDHTDRFAEHHESQLETVVELFQDAVKFWKDEGKTMLVLFSGDPAAPGVARL